MLRWRTAVWLTATNERRLLTLEETIEFLDVILKCNSLSARKAAWHLLQLVAAL